MKAEINAIIRSYENNWEISPKGKEQWINAFFNKIELSDSLSLSNTLKLIKQFYQTNMTEAVFKDYFGPYIIKMPNYKSPMDFHLQLKESELQKIAFSFHNSLNIDYSNSLLLTKRMFHLYESKHWDYNLFMVLLNDYDPKLKLKLIIQEKKIA